MAEAPPACGLGVTPKHSVNVLNIYRYALNFHQYMRRRSDSTSHFSGVLSTVVCLLTLNTKLKANWIVNPLLFSFVSPTLFSSLFSLWYGVFRCLGRAFYPGTVYICLESSPPSLSDDDNSEEGLTTIHSGRHEYAFSLELPQT